MTRMNDLIRVKVATAYAQNDLDTLRAIALSAIADYETAVRAYDALTAEMQRYGVSA